MKGFFIFAFFGLSEMVKRAGIGWISIFGCEVDSDDHGDFKTSWQILCEIIEDNIFEVLDNDNSGIFLSTLCQFILIFALSQRGKIKTKLSDQTVAGAFEESHDNWLLGIMITEFGLSGLEFRISAIYSFPELALVDDGLCVVPDWE